MESIYWVISRDCNQRCPHCYNHSEPGAPGLTLEDIPRVVANLPDPDDVRVDRIILSGGEVLVWPELLFGALRELHTRYGDRVRLFMQTNGDLLDGPMLDRLLAHHVSRISVASMDKYHWKSTRERRGELTELFESRGMISTEILEHATGATGTAPRGYSFWGATDDLWIGKLWPRGRAMQKKLSKAGPDDRFCADWSGAKGFLNYREPGSEVNVQLADVYPCCPMTCRPLGSLLAEPLIAIFDRCAADPVYRALNEGRPEKMGEHLGITEEYAEQRTRELGNHCLWCDEFFTKHAPDMLLHGATTERGDSDLLTLGLHKAGA